MRFCDWSSDVCSSHLHPGVLTVTSFDDYREQLRASFVVIGCEERKTRIRNGLDAICREMELVVEDGETLVDEVAGLVEWPVVMTGTIHDVYMDVPDVVLTTSMREHPKYFALRRPNGSLAPRFAFVRSDDHTSELQSLMLISYAVFCLKKKNHKQTY